MDFTERTILHLIRVKKTQISQIAQKKDNEQNGADFTNGDNHALRLCAEKDNEQLTLI